MIQTLTDTKVEVDVDLDAVIPCQLRIEIDDNHCQRPATKRVIPKRKCTCSKNACAPCIFALSEMVNSNRGHLALHCKRCNEFFAMPGEKFSEVFTVRDL